jgi:hypothetical protein
MIIITAKKDGFRRAGVSHPARPTEYRADAFTEEQLAELQAEPMLVVEIVADKPSDPPPPAAPAPGPAPEPAPAPVPAAASAPKPKATQAGKK